MNADDPPRYYTVAEANAMVGRLRDLFGLVIQLRGQLGALYQRLDAAGHPPRDEDMEEDAEQSSDGAALPPDVIRDQAWFRGLVETLREKLEEVQACGCVIKDVEAGLVDWLARHDGRDVYLCWKLGEPSVAYYHDLDAGFAGRRPLP
ncbi:MAG TPA: DUF2203 domain-containing protein [Kofleriaceae bacterium]|nr:DUF2203 domain-containing protein [Kofleriaceae bacterium]